jgi:hypothetical protein
MSNFLKRGQRTKAIAEKKELKYRTKEFYKILGELDVVAEKIKDSGIEVNEDNIVEEAAKYTDRKIESMERFLLLGKIGKYGE